MLPIQSLYIHSEVADHPTVDRIRKALGIRGIIIDDAEALYRDIARSADPVEAGKRRLLLTQNRGVFLKKCPGTRSYHCCDYQILHIASFCGMDCAYCILQTYFHPPMLQYFVNQEKLMAELETLFDSGRIVRTGTGEFTDSLIWESIDADLTPRLVSTFSRQDAAVLELKTKTIQIAALRNLKHNRKTILAWSVNTPRVIRQEERGTTRLSARLKAARQVEEWGYPVAFHFDPLIIYDGCETEYRKVVQEIFAHVSPGNVVWISLGTLRFMPALKPIIQSRFPSSKIPYGEQIIGIDGKIRYFKPLRIELYRVLVEAIREFAPEVCIYFCMEDDAVWYQSMGFIPADRGGLPRMLDRSAIMHCALKNPQEE